MYVWQLGDFHDNSYLPNTQLGGGFKHFLLEVLPDFLGKMGSKFDFEPMFSLGLEPGRAGRVGFFGVVALAPRVLRREALQPWLGDSRGSNFC